MGKKKPPGRGLVEYSQGSEYVDLGPEGHPAKRMAVSRSRIRTFRIIVGNSSTFLTVSLDAEGERAAVAFVFPENDKVAFRPIKDEPIPEGR